MLYLSRNNRFVGDACECFANGQYFEPERTIEQRHIVFRAWKSVQGRARGNYTCFRSGEFFYMRLCCAPQHVQRMRVWSTHTLLRL